MAEILSVSFEFFPPRTEEGVLKLDKTVKTLSEFNPEFFLLLLVQAAQLKLKH